METEAALDFLARHQPLPDDSELDEQLIHRFDEARRHFETVQDHRCIDLLLNAFGSGSGFGTYQLVEDALRSQDRSKVVDALARAIRNGHGPIRSWAVQIAMEYGGREIVQAVKDV